MPRWLDRLNGVPAPPGYSVVLNPADPRFRAEVKKAIIAAAMDIDSEADVEELRRVAQPWQLESLGYRARLGEVRYAGDFYARPLRRLRWYVGEIGSDGEITETENPTAMAALARVKDPGGGTQALITNYGRLMFFTGETLLLYTPEHEDDDGEVCPETWEMLSTAELRAQPDNSFLRWRAGTTSGGQPLIEGSTVYRLWQRDPMFSDLADCPMRAVLDLCEELTILTLVVRARAISRLAGNGILFVPNDISLPPRQGTVTPDDQMTADPILAELIRSLLAPIEDQGSASAAVPLMLRGPAEAGAQIRHITVRDTSEVFPENALREQTIQRLGLGLDMPPESLTGVSGSNHWNAWQIERDAWRHAEPIARQYADDMTAAYLQPYLRDENGIGDWQRFVVCFDASEILTNPDRGADAKDALTTGAIGFRAYRDAMGWDDEDAPTEEELPLMVTFFGKATPGAVQAEGDAGGSQETGPPPAGPQPQPEADGPQNAGEASRIASALQGAAVTAVLRHREVAGAKIRSKATNCPPCQEEIANVPNSAVAATLGQEACVDLGADDPDRLVQSREQTFATVAARYGVSGSGATTLARLVEHHAARTLFTVEPPMFPLAAMLSVLERETL